MRLIPMIAALSQSLFWLPDFLMKHDKFSLFFIFFSGEFITLLFYKNRLVMECLWAVTKVLYLFYRSTYTEYANNLIYCRLVIIKKLSKIYTTWMVN